MNQTNADIYHQLLRFLPHANRQSWSQDLINNTDYQYTVLAARFVHDVKQGGFALLLHNLNGQMLAEMEDMLLHAKAKFAHDYYIQAIRACLFHQTEYEALLRHEDLIASETELLLQLHELSQNYLGANLPLEFEAEEFLLSLLSTSSIEPVSPGKAGTLFAISRA